MIWCAEIGSCHMGSKSLAFELIRKAKWAGATIAKFQLGWTPEAEAKYATSEAPLREDRLSWAKGSVIHKCSIRYIDDWAEDLAQWCADMDIEFMASIWSLAGLEVARSVGMKRYKIAHQLDMDMDLRREIRREGKAIFNSSNAQCMEDYQIFAQEDYPTYSTGDMPMRFGRSFFFDAPRDFYGYSSHMHGIADALIAVARGAEYIEKHLTLYKYAGFPKDASFALTPDEFKTMTEVGNEIARLR